MGDQATTRALIVDALGEAEHPLTPSGLSERIDRTGRSVRLALRELERDEKVEWRYDHHDARYRLYSLTEPSTSTGGPEAKASGPSVDTPSV